MKAPVCVCCGHEKPLNGFWYGATGEPHAYCSIACITYHVNKECGCFEKEGPMNPTLAEQIAEVKREIAIRERVYPKWVKDGKMKAHAAERGIALMKAALHTLMALDVPG